MPSKEIPQQFDMFTGELVDTRNRRQRKLDRERDLPRQIEMFSQRDVAQFGVRANPTMPLSGNVKLILIPEDPRTDEEIERDIQREAERRTVAMFADTPEGQPCLALVPRGVVALVGIQDMCRALISLDLA